MYKGKKDFTSHLFNIFKFGGGVLASLFRQFKVFSKSRNGNN